MAAMRSGTFRESGAQEGFERFRDEKCADVAKDGREDANRSVAGEENRGGQEVENESRFHTEWNTERLRMLRQLEAQHCQSSQAE